MGWLFFKKPGNVAEYFRREFTFDGEHAKYAVLDIAIVNITTAYLAVERIEKATGMRTVSAIILLLRFVPNASDGYTFGYKDMDEACGPNECHCPERILKLLTPTNGLNASDEGRLRAKEWRERCRAYHAQRRRFKDGAIFRMSSGISYQKEKRYWFKVHQHGKRKAVYCLDGGFRVQFPTRFLENAVFQVVTPGLEDRIKQGLI